MQPLKQISGDWNAFWRNEYPPLDLHIAIDTAVHLRWHFESVHQLDITSDTLVYCKDLEIKKTQGYVTEDYDCNPKFYVLVAEDLTVELDWNRIAVLQYCEDDDNWYWLLIEFVSPLVVRQVLRALGLAALPFERQSAVRDANSNAD